MSRAVSQVNCFSSPPSCLHLPEPHARKSTLWMLMQFRGQHTRHAFTVSRVWTRLGIVPSIRLAMDACCATRTEASSHLGRRPFSPVYGLHHAVSYVPSGARRNSQRQQVNCFLLCSRRSRHADLSISIAPELAHLVLFNRSVMGTNPLGLFMNT